MKTYLLNQAKKISKFGVFVLAQLLCAAALKAEVLHPVSGVVSDQKGSGLPGVAVFVENTPYGTTTDRDGKFVLRIPEKAALTFSFLGYVPQTIPVEGKTYLSVVLAEDAQELNEVVVIGFGTQKKVNLTGAVATADVKQLEDRPVQNVLQSLQGLVPGLNVTVGGGGGFLNAKPSIDIRGVGTIGYGSSGSPLTLVDGIEADLTTINPDDIESISVLKDAASAAIYGSRAPFGVILVTTKKGKSGKATISYTNNFRFSSPIGLPEMANSYEFALTFNTASNNAGWGNFFNPDVVQRIKQYIDGEISTPTIADPNNPKWWANGYGGANANVNYYDVFYRKNAPAQEHNLSISGGNDRTKYYISANYMGMKGLLNYGSDRYDRIIANASIDTRVNRFITLSYSGRFTKEMIDYPSHLGGNFYEDIGRQMWPMKPLYDNNGLLFDDHVLGLRDGGRNKTDNNIMVQKIQLTLDLLEGFKVIGSFDYRLDHNLIHNDALSYHQMAVDGVSNGQEWYNSNVSESAAQNQYLNTSIYGEYQKQFNNGHYFKVMVGFQTEANFYRDFSAKKEGLLSPYITALNAASGIGQDGKLVPPEVYGWYGNWKTAGFFSRVNYNYKERYLFEANLRYDGSSRFASKNRWGLFPSVSIGWNIANEAFFGEAKRVVDMLKIRASYGSLGNQNTSSLYPTYQLMNYSCADGSWLVGGYQPNQAWAPNLINPDLTWETIRTWDAGLDFSFFKNRLSGSFDLFERYTNNMVGPAEELPSILGTSVPGSNNTDLKTSGFEFSLSWRDRTKFGLGYMVRVSLADSRTKILRYPNPTNSLDHYREGQYLGEIWGYTTVGIAKTDEQMAEHLNSMPMGGQDWIGDRWGAGDIMYADVDGNGRIDWGESTADDSGDLRIIGNSTPRYTYGITLAGDYKGFDLNIFLQGVMKREYIQDSYYFYGINGRQSGWESTVFTEHMDYFRGDADDPLGQNLDAYYARPIFGSNKNQLVQTRFVQDASYLRLKNIQIGYTLPHKITRKVGINKLRIYFSGENLLTFTDLSPIFDPETIDKGWGGSVYPISKTVSFGINLTF